MNPGEAFDPCRWRSPVADKPKPGSPGQSGPPEAAPSIEAPPGGNDAAVPSYFRFGLADGVAGPPWNSRGAKTYRLLLQDCHSCEVPGEMYR